MVKAILQNIGANRDEFNGWIETDICKGTNEKDYGLIRMTEGKTVLSYIVERGNIGDIDDIIKGLQEMKERLEKAYKEE